MSKKEARHQVFVELVSILDRMSYTQQLAIAEQAEVHVMTLYWWCTGVTQSPRFNTVIRVAEALGYEIQLNRPKRHLKRVS